MYALNFNKLGEFKLCYSHGDIIMGLQPALKEVKIDSYTKVYRTGFIDSKKNFLESAWQIFFVTLEEINCKAGSTSQAYSLSFKLTDKSNNEEYFMHTFNNSGLHPLSNLINYSNIYINNDLPSNLFNFELAQKYTFKSWDAEYLFKMINNLHIEYWYDSISRVGKDNIFTTEAIIKLPEDTYLQDLIFNGLSEYSYKRINSEMNLIVEVDRDYAYSPADGRGLERTVSANEIDYLKEKIKIYSLLNYKEEEHFIHYKNSLIKIFTNASK